MTGEPSERLSPAAEGFYAIVAGLRRILAGSRTFTMGHSRRFAFIRPKGGSAFLSTISFAGDEFPLKLRIRPVGLRAWKECDVQVSRSKGGGVRFQFGGRFLSSRGLAQLIIDRLGVAGGPKQPNGKQPGRSSS